MNIPNLTRKDLFIPRIKYYMGGAILFYYRTYRSIIRAYRKKLILTVAVALNIFPRVVEFDDGERVTVKNRFDLYSKGINHLSTELKIAPHDHVEQDQRKDFGDSKINISGLTTLVIGAFHGEDAIKYAELGSKEVIAYEPFPYSYNIAVRNISETPYRDSIHVINSGVGIRGYIVLPEDYESGPGDDTNRTFESGKKINVISLKDAISNIDSNCLFLSMNCEGCEYDAIGYEEDEIIRRFKYIHIEYHYGYVQLVKKLEKANFKVYYTKPRYSVNKYTKENPIMLMGSIYAIRRDDATDHCD